MVEAYEDEIVDWFKNHQHKQPIDYICRDHVLIGKDNSTLLLLSLYYSNILHSQSF